MPSITRPFQPVSRASQALEVVVPLDTWYRVNTPFGSFQVFIHDHGIATISAAIDYGGPRRIEKVKGFETTGTNIVQIHALSGARVYYVDRIDVPSGNCVLKVIPTG